MELAFSADQSVLSEAFGQFFARESSSAVVRRSEPLGFDVTLWDALNTMQVWDSDASIADVCVIGESVGRALAPVPFVDQVVVSRLLRWPSLLAGDSIGSISPRHANERGIWPVVPAGAVADVVVGMDGDDFVAVRAPAPFVGPHNHACAPLADRSARVGERTVIGARADFDQAMAEWKVITASMLVGIAAASLEIGVEYAQHRHQFGVPIGSFQAVQHALADLPGRIDGARLLTHEAAWAIDASLSGNNSLSGNDDATDLQTLASMAVLFAGDVAADATARSLHVHGGYGFADEYDIQLFYRRARGWALVLGDPTNEYLAVADRLWPSAPHSQRGSS